MDDCDLEKLIVKPGKLVPKFNRNTTEYEILLNSGIAELKIDPLTRDSNASWTVVGVGTSRSIPVKEGSCFDVCVEVSAEDGTTKQYTIKVTSLSKSSAVLSHIHVTDYELNPKPSMNVLNYECYVPCSCSSISISADSPDKKTKIEIPDSEENDIPLNFGLTIVDINVTSPDGTKTVKYTINVCRHKLIFPIDISSNFKCTICLCPLHCPISLKDVEPKQYFCDSCIQLVTRSNNYHPLTGVALPDDFILKEYEMEKKISMEIVKCTLGCGVELQLRMLADHLINACSLTLSHVEKVDHVLLGNSRQDDSYINTTACSSCTRAVPNKEMQFHTDHICISNHEYKFTHKVEPRKWEKIHQQEFIPDDGVDSFVEGKEEEAKYLQILSSREESTITSNAHKNLEKACQLYCHGIGEKTKEHELHYRLGVIYEEMHYLKDIFGVGGKEKQKAAVEEGDEFQTEESMQDDIMALTEQCGFGSNANATDQLKALDQEYHFLLEQGQSERADYVQKLYAFKQNQQHRSGNVNTEQHDDTLIGKANTKYMDAASLDSNKAVYQVQVGKCLLRMKAYEEAEKRLKYALALKPVNAEARFYLGYTLSKLSQDNATIKDNALNFLRSGLYQFLYKMNWNTQTEKQCISETFASVYNTLLLDGVYELSNLLDTNNQDTIFKPEQLLDFLSSVCFLSMYKSLKRGDTYKHLISLALECQYRIGKRLMDGEQSEYTKKQLRSYWERLSSFTGNICRFGNKEALVIQKKISEAAVILTPRSGKTLCRLGEVLFVLSEHSPTSIGLGDIEKCFRSSLEVEGKNIHEEELPKELIESDFWKDHVKRKEASSSLKEEVSTGKSPGKTAPPKGGVKTPVKQTPGTKNTTVTTRTVPAAKTAPISKKPGGASPVVATPMKKNVGRGPIRTPAKPAPKQNTTGSKLGNANTIGCSSSHETSHAKSQEKGGKRGSNASLKSTTNVNVGKMNDTSKEARIVQTSTELTKEEELNPVQYKTRLGLARVLVASSKEDTNTEIETLYKEVIEMAPNVHSAYIELGEILAKTRPMEAVEIYSKFASSENSYDDAYIYGEIVRLLMKQEQFNDPRLKDNMIALGKIMGFSTLERYVSALEKDYKNNKLLREVYAGINGKPVDDPDLQIFFKMKFWK